MNTETVESIACAWHFEKFIVLADVTSWQGSSRTILLAYFTIFLSRLVWHTPNQWELFFIFFSLYLLFVMGKFISKNVILTIDFWEKTVKGHWMLSHCMFIIYRFLLLFDVMDLWPKNCKTEITFYCSWSVRRDVLFFKRLETNNIQSSRSSPFVRKFIRILYMISLYILYYYDYYL